MPQSASQGMTLILEDLNSLIQEIEHNPYLSSWVIRRTLQSIQFKAKKIAAQDYYYQELPQPVVSFRDARD